MLPPPPLTPAATHAFSELKLLLSGALLQQQEEQQTVSVLLPTNTLMCKGRV